MAIAYRIIGELENQESLGLGGELYPLGQNIRGALGYAFLDMSSEISKTYIQQVNPVLYFRDCLMLCKCNERGERGELIPLVRQDVVGGRVIKEIIYKCNKCGVVNRNPVSRDKIMGTHISETGSANTFVDDIVSNVERTKFKFEVILKESKSNSNSSNGSGSGSEYLAELLACIKFIEDNGLYVGKRKDKGLGKMSLKHVKISEIGMKEISQRGDDIEKKAQKDNGVLTIRLVSDGIGKSPITGDDLLRDIKNAIKFFHPHWHEIRDEYRDPKMNLIGKNIELGERKTVYFLDCKVDKDSSGMKIENMKLDKSDNVISRGTQYSYQLYDVDKISSEFWNGLAMAEMLRGIGDRSSFGKGQFVVS